MELAVGIIRQDYQMQNKDKFDRRVLHLRYLP
jgi:hypothetical protein